MFLITGGFYRRLRLIGEDLLHHTRRAILLIVRGQEEMGLFFLKRVSIACIHSCRGAHIRRIRGSGMAKIAPKVYLLNDVFTILHQFQHSSMIQSHEHPHILKCFPSYMASFLIALLPWTQCWHSSLPSFQDSDLS